MLLRIVCIAVLALMFSGVASAYYVLVTNNSAYDVEVSISGSENQIPKGQKQAFFVENISPISIISISASGPSKACLVEYLGCTKKEGSLMFCGLATSTNPGCTTPKNENGQYTTPLEIIVSSTF